MLWHMDFLKRAISDALDQLDPMVLIDVWQNYTGRELEDEPDLLDDMGNLVVPLDKALDAVDKYALVNYYADIDEHEDAWLPDELHEVIFK